VRPDDSVKGASRAGWLIILVFFGALGIWGSFAPLNAAVMGDAVVSVEGNRKSVAHLTGGKVSEVLVREGDLVSAGDVLLILDATDNRAQVEMLTEQQAQLLAIEARLRSEYTGLSSITFPIDLMDRRNEPAVLAAMRDQTEEFDSRRKALWGNRAVLEQRVAQYG